MNSAEIPAATSAVDYDPFAGVALARSVPATESQREIWLAAKLEPAASLAYNEAVSLRLRGPLDAAALRSALQALVDRHEALRGTLGANGTDFLIAERVELPWTERDLVPLAPAAREAEISATLRRVVETPFDLENGPLIRAELLRIDAVDHLLVLTAHHIVCDGWSWGVLVRDLAALLRGEANLPPAEPFGDFALGEAASVDSEAHRAAEAYWLSRFDPVPPALDLPTDRPRPRQRSFASLREDRVLDADLVAQLRRLGGRNKASLYACLLAGFASLLQRISGQHELVVGIPAAGQAGSGHTSLVGHCVNVLPLRVAIDAQAPFVDLLNDLCGNLLDAFEHQRYTLGSLLKRLALPRDASRLPLVSVLFNLDQALDDAKVAFPGLAFEFDGVARTFENFELFVNAVQVDGALRLECQYNRDLFDAATVQAWLDAYETLLRSAVADATTPSGQLEWLSDTAATRLDGLQPSRTPYAIDRLAHEYFEAQVDRAAQRPAVRDARARWTYAELEQRANRIAHALRSRGVRRGALVGLSLARSADMLAAVLATLKSGAGYVPLDPAFPPERLKFMVDDTALAALIVDDEVPAGLAFPAERTLSLARDASLIAGAPSMRPERDDSAATPDSTAYVIFTSGSTGLPKGVCVPHRTTSNLLASLQVEPGITADDRLVAVTTLSFDIAFMELMLPLSVGAEIVIADRDDVRDGAALRRLLEDSAATMMQATPAGWRILLDAGWQGHRGFRAVSGGEPLPVDLALSLLERCGEVWNGYGPTETTVYSTFWRVTDPRSGIRIGRPIANTNVRVLDAFGSQCPLGVPGELVIGGDGVTLGYLNRTELDAERFIADPAATAPWARRYRTGDRGRWTAAGLLEHLGRLDFQIKVRGYRIEPGEIEAKLAEIPGVARAVVIAREFQAGDVRLVAYVVAGAGSVLEATDLVAHLRHHLPEYMVPQHVVLLDAIPLSPNGKVDRNALPAPAREATPQAERIAPRNDRECRIAATMEEVLSLPGLGIDDDFFALGGHSLLAAQLTSRLNREFGVTLSLRTLFDTPTIAGLSAAIESQLHGAAPHSEPIVRRTDQTRAPLSLMQQRLWDLEELHPGRVTYNTPSAHRLSGPLDEAAFARAFAEMVRRQPILRTAIRREDDRVVQIVEPTLDLALFPAEDLSALPPNERERQLMSRMQALVDTPFDLTRAPLFRARMFRLADDEHVLFFTPHHIIWDGWSFDLLYSELAQLYRALKAGSPSPLPELSVSYGDFAVWHQRWLESERFGSQLAYWRGVLAKVPETEPLPTDMPRRPGMSGDGRTEWMRISRESTATLHDVASAAGATLNMVLLAAYYAVLWRMSAQRNLVVGTPVRGRDQGEVEAVMGYFNNLVPLHVTLDPEQPFIDFVRQVRTVVIDSLGNPDVPLEYLQHELRAGRGGTGLLYQALFSFQDARQREVDWGGLRHEQIPLFQSGATEDLGLWFLENHSGMVGGIIYNAQILRPGSARRLCDRYMDLLERVGRSPHDPLHTLTAIDAAELECQRQWNATALAPTTRVTALFERQVDAAPERTASSYGSWGTSYAELEQRANRVAACLRTRGVGRDSIVGICVEPGVSQLAGLLGILKIGATVVPLDPADRTGRLRDILVDAQADVLVTRHALAASLEWPRERALAFDGDNDELIGASAARVEDASAIDADTLALMLYEPHASGELHGIGIDHVGLAARLNGLQQRLGLSRDDRIATVMPQSCGWSVIGPLLALTLGAETAQPGVHDAADHGALLSFMASARPGVMFARPDTWRALFAAGWEGDAGLRAVCAGSGWRDDDLVQRLQRSCRETWNTFGTEAGGIVASCGRIDDMSTEVHAGAPLGGTQVWVLDEFHQPCPIGATGEIWIGGVGLPHAAGTRAPTMGGASDPPEFALAPNERLRRTHSRGRWLANGTIEELGHTNHPSPLRGLAVDPRAVEARLRLQPGITEAIVVGRTAADGDAWLDAYAAATPGSEESLRQALGALLRADEMPRHVLALDALPRLPSGVVDIARLPVRGPDPAGAGAAQSGAPATDAERLLADVWRELLGVPEVTADDNFFDLGGHSLLATSMVARIEKETGVRLNLMRVVNSTLRALAADLPANADAATAPQPARSFGQRFRSLLGLGNPGQKRS